MPGLGLACHPNTSPSPNKPFGAGASRFGKPKMLLSLLYAILCGFHPFPADHMDDDEAARGSYSFPIPWWDDISASAKEVVEHLLSVKPSKRYTIKKFFAHPWCSHWKQTHRLRRPGETSSVSSLCTRIQEESSGSRTLQALVRRQAQRAPARDAQKLGLIPLPSSTLRHRPRIA
ncbi:hypothetical protein B0H13DRAFT_2464188 [Mycena leptocephala]|nr:hypothetical protein B0H13DRAFT_2464188 [Mycena leptocephala]